MAQKEWVESENQVDLEEPELYKVIMWNDNYTTMDFVVEVLADIFHKSYDEAVEIMLAIHEQGKGVCGTYIYEIAETKVHQTLKRARANEFPLRVTMEKE
ncbi:ATP-dependent Clp protease adaptor ClpS [Hydrogenimonas sp.]|uniref:ATP-dependent Clp protease adaptor ClpS n=1 Tax=Hydrogenimonas sp. TaxID=2231112 RepID=UPI00262275BA|nr:ATP-dependent Clp protease adaptor ClpS [Hydrogenimonas sp.]